MSSNWNDGAVPRVNRRHWVEAEADLSKFAADVLEKAKSELAADVCSIQTELGDLCKRHTNGIKMTTYEWNEWRQRTKRKLKFAIQHLLRVKAELQKRSSHDINSLAAAIAEKLQGKLLKRLDFPGDATPG